MTESKQKQLVEALLINNGIKLDNINGFASASSCLQWAEQEVPTKCYNAIVQIMSTVTRDNLMKFVADKNIRTIIEIWDKGQYQEYEFEAPKYLKKVEEIMTKYTDKNQTINFKMDAIKLIDGTIQGIKEIFEIRGDEINLQYNQVLSKLENCKDKLSSVIDIDSQNAFERASDILGALSIVRERVIKNIIVPTSTLATLSLSVDKWCELKSNKSIYKKGKISLDDEFGAYIAYGEKQLELKEIIQIIKKREQTVFSSINRQRQFIEELNRKAIDTARQCKNGFVSKMRYAEVLKDITYQKSKAEEKLQVYKRISNSQIEVDFMHKISDIMEVCELQAISYKTRQELFGSVDLSFLINSNDNDITAGESDNMYAKLNQVIADFEVNLAINNESMRQIRQAIEELSSQRQNVFNQVLDGDKQTKSIENQDALNDEIAQMEKQLGLDFDDKYEKIQSFEDDFDEKDEIIQEN